VKLLEVLRYELEHRFRSGSTWVYAALLFGLALANAIDTGSVDALNANAPSEMAFDQLFLGLLGLVASAGLFGDAALRDTDAGMDPLLYTSPLRTLDYLGGRYLATATVNAVLLLTIPLGFALATLIGYPDPAHFGPFRIAAVLQPWLILLLPNMVFTGAVLFAVAALTRHLIPVYLSGFGLFATFLVTAEAGPNERALGVDPGGIAALEAIYRYWTAAERNTQLVGVSAELLLNRILWLAVTGGVLVLLHKSFRFAHAQGGGSIREHGDTSDSARAVGVRTTRAATVFDARTTARQTLAIARNSLIEVAAYPWFAGVVLACAGASMVLTTRVGGSPFDTSTWPVTLLVAEAMTTRFLPALCVLVGLYAGELVWKDRDVRVSEIADGMPVTDGVTLVGRFLALAAMLAMFLAACMVGGILMQLFEGYFNVEPGLYLRILFGMDFADVMLFAALAMAIHIVVNQKYLGHMVVLTAVGVRFGAPPFRHHLLSYGTDPGWAYSDMNGFGPFLAPFVWFKLYWAGWALLLAIVACVLWVRGRESGTRRRLSQARTRFTGPLARATGLAVGLIVAFGGFIFYNTNVLNAYGAADDAEALQAEYEKRYGRFEHAPQPTLESAKLRVEIYPEERAVDLSGSYRLVNRTNGPIDSVHVFSGSDVETRSISFDRGATAVLADSAVGYRVFTLARPLAPGDSILLSFDVAFRKRGFPNGGIRTDVVENGTYFEREWFPFVGYQPAFAISDASTRERFGLERRPPPAGPDVVAARGRRYGIRNEDKVRVETIVGTTEDQIGIAAGVLRREWKEKGRRYFQYEMERPQSFGGAVFSGRYAVHEDRWTDSSGSAPGVALSVYHHPDHARNLDTFIRSMKASLDYFTRAFGPYESAVLRLVETIPRASLSARARPNTVILAENSFFTRKMEGQVDQLLFATAHEISHQWWGGQIRGAVDVRGSQGFLSESLANYSALMVTEKMYGVEAARRVVAFQLDAYLTARASEYEVPITEMQYEPFIMYRKGLLSMYLMRNSIGEGAMNTALRRFVDKHRAGVPPYPTALDVVAELRAVTPDSLRYLVTDLFETVTMWDTRTERAVVEPTGTGEYRVTLDVVAKKLRTDAARKPTEVPMDDVIEVGAFGPSTGTVLGEPLYLQRHRIRSGKQTITFTVPKMPARAGIDPYRKLIERVGRDNVAYTVARGATSRAASR
jgi:ABC-2 type transport system permease protein